MAAKIEAAAMSFGMKERMMTFLVMEEAAKPLFSKRAVRSRRVAVQAFHRRRFSAQMDI
jgi:hypothetical protein